MASSANKMENLEINEMQVVPCTNSPYIQSSRVTFKQNGINRIWDYIREHDGVYILLYNTTRQAFVLVKQFRPARLNDSARRCYWMIASLHRLHRAQVCINLNTKIEQRLWPSFQTMIDYVLMFPKFSNNFTFLHTALYMTLNREQHVKQTDNLHKEHVQKIDSSIPYTAPPDCGISYELCAGIVDKQTSLQEIAKEEAFEECGYDIRLGDIRRVMAWRGDLGTACNTRTLFYSEVTDAMQVPGAGGGNLQEGEQIELFYLPVSELRSFMYNEDIAKESSLLFAFSWWVENVQKA